MVIIFQVPSILPLINGIPVTVIFSNEQTIKAIAFNGFSHVDATLSSFLKILADTVIEIAHELYKQRKDKNNFFINLFYGSANYIAEGATA